MFHCFKKIRDKKATTRPGRAAQLVRGSVVLIHQGCGIDLWSGHTQEAIIA